MFFDPEVVSYVNLAEVFDVETRLAPGQFGLGANRLQIGHQQTRFHLLSEHGFGIDRGRQRHHSVRLKLALSCFADLGIPVEQIAAFVSRRLVSRIGCTVHSRNLKALIDNDSHFPSNDT